MMYKRFFLLLLATSVLHPQEYPHNVPITQIFSTPDLRLSVRQNNQVQELLHTIEKSSVHEQIEAAQEAVRILEQEIEQRRLIYETADEQDKEFIGYKAGILIAQAHWLKHIAKKMSYCLPLHKQASGFCKKHFKELKRKTAQLFRRSYSNLNLTNQLLSYAQLEREHIFSTYPSTLAHAVINEHKDLPELMAFWSSQRKQWLLLNESKKYLYQPRVQAMDAAVEATEEAIASAEEDAVQEAIEEAARDAIAGVTASQAAEDADGASSVGAEGLNAADAESVEEEIVNLSTEANEATSELVDTDEIEGALSKTAQRLQSLWKGLKWVGKGLQDAFEYVPGKTAISKVLEVGMKLATGPMRGLWSLIGRFLPEAVDMADITASMSEGALAAADLTPEALEQASDTVEEFAAQGKKLASRLAKKGFGKLLTKSVTEDEIAELSESAAAANEGDGLSGAIRARMSQIRGQAAEALESEGPETAFGRAWRWLRGGSRRMIGRSLRALNEGAGEEIGQAAEALRLSEAGLGGTGVLTKDTTELLQEVKAFREELMTPLTKSGRVLRMMGNINRAFAANYPMIHMAVSMTLFMDMMMGGQLAISWENQAQAKEYISMTQQRNKISSGLQSELSQIELTKKASLRQLDANKAKMLLDILKINKQLGTGTVHEINYVVQSISGFTPQHIYLSEPMMYDQYFYYSPMLTPSAQEPLFPRGNEDSPWIVRPKNPPILKQRAAGWIVKQSQSDAPTAPGTGEWIVGEKSSRETNNPIIFTQQFNIPEQFPTNPVAHTWYNPFRAGNWIFNPDENAFIQYLMQPITSSSAPQGDAAQALQNSIFTEYIPPVILNKDGVMTYIVQVEMKIYNAQFPFFAGIFFNGGRWISGSSDLRKQHRLFGLYGAPDKEISLRAAETAYISEKNQLQEKTSLTALEQVLALPTTKREWEEKYRSLIPNPLYPNKEQNSVPLEVGKTYILTAATQPTRIMLKLEEKTDQGMIPIFGPSTIIHRNPFVFIYHNIGFVSGGCSAGFKLIQPQQLAYTESMLEKFKTEIGLSETREVGRS